jgi:hypothetical protein
MDFDRPHCYYRQPDITRAQFASLAIYLVLIPAVLAQQVVRELGTLVSGISDDCANVRKQWPQATEQPRSRLSVGDVGWLHSACDQQPEGVHQNVALAAFHAVVRIESAECRRVLWSLATERP